MDPSAVIGTGPARSGMDAASPASGALIEVKPHNCFACGQLNASGMQLDLHLDGDRCWTTLAVPERFEGWKGLTHGGILSAIMDEVMAWSLIAIDQIGVTARLEVDFKRPVPVGVPIRAEGWLSGRRRRLLDTAARIVDVGSGETLVEARATYVAAPPDRAREVRDAYGFRITRPEGGG
jgi:acyl-coenzyme A thioesterase PaaI-like protein